MVFRASVGLLAAYGLLWVLELAAFGRERAAASWRWPEPAAETFEPHAELGFVARGFQPKPGGDDPPLVTILTDRLIGRPDPGRDAQLRRRCGERGILALRARFLDMPFATTAQRALSAPRDRDAVVVLVVNAADIVADAHPRVAGFAAPRLARKADAIVATLAPAATPHGRRGWIGFLPGIRTWLQPAESVEPAPADGLFPQWLWPYRRNGAAGETKHWQPTALAIEMLRDALRAVSSRLVVVWLPLPIESNSSDFSSLLHELGLDSASVEGSRPARRLADECARLKVPFVNATRTLRRKKPGEGRVFYDSGSLAARLTERGRSAALGVIAGAVHRVLTNR